ncbi:unnamed protein product [Nezara viridula]|uniref:Uncharacterized protein n=1 Tax=Nezara viridula TaxID=85310 RepID=A0A9P0HEW0_NEZVI|nr:unnamed protein product [Nezara viridula]
MNFESCEVNMSQWKREFPLSVRDALMKAEELINSASTSSRHQGIKQSELAMELITESVFCESDRRGVSKMLSKLQEAELMEVISDHMLYDARGSEASRNALFQALFPPTATSRIHFLVSLISLAISTRNTPVLKAASILLQQAGCSTPFSGKVARGLVEEFFILVNANCQVVIDLPKIAPLFTAIFLSALAYGYICIDGASWQHFPPDCFIEVITRWVREHQDLCHAPLKENCILIPGIRPPTPYLGLFVWSVMSCLNGRGEVYTELYNILCSIFRGGSLLVSEDLKPLVCHLSAASSRICSSDSNLKETSLVVAVDRFSRFLSMAVAEDTLYVDQDFWLSVSELYRISSNSFLSPLLEKHLPSS